MPLVAQLAAAVALGCAAGAALGPRAAVLGELAIAVVKILKALAAPLLLFAIVDAVRATGFGARRGAALIGISLVNAAVAGSIALAVAHAWPVERTVDLGAMQRALATALAAVRPAALDSIDRVLDHLVVDRILWVVAAALAIGALLRLWRRLGRADKTRAAVERAAAAGLRASQRAIGLAIHLVPLAAFGILARVVGTSGFRLFAALGVFVALVTFGIALHALGWYALVLRAVARLSPAAFFRDAAAALGTALSTGSSLATLPVTLRTLERRGVSRESAHLAACVGTNLNHDGILLYEATAALFVARAFGVKLSFGAQLKLLATSAVAAVGIAGVPEAGLITLSLVLGAAGLPLAAVPLLLPVDWFLGRLRAACNVASDLTVATLLDHFFKTKN